MAIFPSVHCIPLFLPQLDCLLLRPLYFKISRLLLVLGSGDVSSMSAPLCPGQLISVLISFYISPSSALALLLSIHDCYFWHIFLQRLFIFRCRFETKLLLCIVGDVEAYCAPCDDGETDCYAGFRSEVAI